METGNTDAEPWVTAYKAPDEWRAELVRGFLADADIPVVVQNNAVPGYNMLMGGQHDCWAELRVPAESLSRAQDVMRTFMPEEEAPEERT
jgi:hypothetical protein